VVRPVTRFWRPADRLGTPWAALAGWPSRALGAVVDQAFCAAILAPVGVFGAVVGGARALLSPTPTLGETWGLLGTTAVWTGVVAAVTCPYYVLGERRAGQTLGKAAARVRVLDAATGGPVRTAQALMRWLVRLVLWVPLPMLTFGLGLGLAILDALWPLWDQRGQALHDKLAGTLVVTTRPPRWNA
jgi:uncharacterized RDD family membrane protein YckC